MFNAPNTKRNRIAALIAIALGLGVGFYMAVSDKDDDAERVDGSAAEAVNVPNSESVPATSSNPTPLPPMPKSLSLEDIDFNSYSKDLAKFTGLKEGQSRGEAVDNVRLYFAPEAGNAIISTSQSKFERDDGAVLIFGASGLPDDSVKSEEIYLIVSGEKGSQILAAFGSRIKCHRGENTTEWQTDLCP
ncbi:MAG: hypothetical protein ABJN69_17555 [Hellea sp.]